MISIWAIAIALSHCIAAVCQDERALQYVPHVQTTDVTFGEGFGFGARIKQKIP